MPCFGRRIEKRSKHQHAVSCQSYKKGFHSFLLIQPGKSAAIFSRTCTECGAYMLCKHFFGYGREERRLEKMRRKEGHNRGCLQRDCRANNPTEWVYVSISLLVSMCDCVCVRGPLNSRPFYNPTVQESGDKTPKIPSAINLPLPPVYLSHWAR